MTETGGSSTVTYLYGYDTVGRLISSEKKTGTTSTLRTSQSYNAYNQLTAQGWQMGSTAYSETYTYNAADGSLATMKAADGKTLTMNYDGLRRLSSVTGGVGKKSYTYRDISTTQTTTQVASLTYDLPADQVYSYTYDSLGNIATYTATGKSKVTYTYDSQGQLLKATDGTTTYSYTYDTVGNLLTANGHTYTYGNADWKDLLTAFDGQTISYDTSGNPTSYYNGARWTFGWANGRNLVSASGGGKTVSYSYDLSGQRTGKTVDGTVHNYLYASGKLLRETYGSNTLDFFYDAAGTPYALKYNGTVYYYITNLQGDVIQVVNSSGSVVASYDYDPYGKVISATGDLAEINPLRYRGYYYDAESGLYYLQSRYYDPEVGRFINADALVSTGQGIIGNNMFAYCGNNPVTYTDPAGSLRAPCTICVTNTGLPGYIYNQDTDEMRELEMGWGNMADNGCGIIAIYNALISLGCPQPFREVYSRIAGNSNSMVLNGWLGTAPWAVCDYFKELGFSVSVEYFPDQIDSHSRTAKGCILLYFFVTTYSWNVGGQNYSIYIPQGAHYVEYGRNAGGYIGRNTAEGGGLYLFESPSAYGYSGNRVYAVGIYVY